jgi:phage-related protein (TIGR01555 family)
MGSFRKALRWLLGSTAPAIAAEITRPLWPNLPHGHAAEARVSDVALAEATAAYGRPLSPWKMPDLPPFAEKAGAQLAMDAAPGPGDVYNWAAGGLFSEGIGFLGYAYLAELSQRPEYRRVSEIFAAEATRKWIKLAGNPDRIDAIEAQMKRFDLRHIFRRVVELDGFFGRGQIYIDLGDDVQSEELMTPLLAEAKVDVGSIKNFKIIEPFWSYPGTYDSVNPMDPGFYKPDYWYVMASRVHFTRLLTVIGREMPDMLKPAYSFGGLALSQMIKPYVDNFLRTRQSVSDLLHSFSTMVLSTDMTTILGGGTATNLLRRLQLFTQARDNRGVMAVNKETEELSNVSTPLGTLDKLQAQSQEQIASVAGIPLVILLGVTPSGLNASSDGEVRSFYANVKSYQERALRRPIHTCLDLIQLDLDGKIDPDITFEFHDLWETPDTEKAVIRKTDADIDSIYAGIGVVDNEEVRERITNDEGSPYFGAKLVGNDELNAPPPTPEELAKAKAANDPNPMPGAKPGQPGMKQAKAANDSAVTISYDPIDLYGLALDEQHWITVHPHGDDEGQPVLIEGSAGGGYVIIGGAGGALNGTHVNPGSMSGPKKEQGGHRTHEEATAAAHAASNHAHEKGTSEAHEVAAAAHATAKEHNRVAGEHDKETEHGKSFAEHKGISAKLQNGENEPKAEEPKEKTKADLADEYTAHAEKEGTAIAHEWAEHAHNEAKEDARDKETGNWETGPDGMKMYVIAGEPVASVAQLGPREYFSVLPNEPDVRFTGHTVDMVKAQIVTHFIRKADKEASRHAVVAEHHRIEARKAELPDLTAKADAASAHAKRDKSAEAHKAAAQAHIAALKAHEAARENPRVVSLLEQHHRKQYVDHMKKFEAIDNKERAAARVDTYFSPEQKTRLANIEKKYASTPVEDIKTDLHNRFGLNFRDGGDAATKAYNEAYWTHSKTQAGMTDGQRDESEANVAKLRDIARQASVGNVGKLQHHSMNATDKLGAKHAENARKALGHVSAALEHLESSGFNIKEVLSRNNIAFVPGTASQYGGISWQHNGTGHFNLSSSKINPTDLSQYANTAKQRAEKGLPKWTADAGRPAEEIPMFTAIHELAHAIGMHPGNGSVHRLDMMLREKFPRKSDRVEWVKNNISEYATENQYEADAELASMVAGPGYVRGTLPVEFENHVDTLFGRKAPAAAN